VQPIYCTWAANGKKVHTPGLGRRVTEVEGWVNSALGELATLYVESDDQPARHQQRALLHVNVPHDAAVIWNSATRTLSVGRRRCP